MFVQPSVCWCVYPSLWLWLSVYEFVRLFLSLYIRWFNHDPRTDVRHTAQLTQCLSFILWDAELLRWLRVYAEIARSDKLAVNCDCMLGSADASGNSYSEIICDEKPPHHGHWCLQIDANTYHLYKTSAKLCIHWRKYWSDGCSTNTNETTLISKWQNDIFRTV